MSRFSYSTSIDLKSVIKDQIQGRFNDLETFIDTTKFRAEHFQFGAFRYRHIKHPEIPYLSDRKVGTAIWTNPLDKTGNWNWTNCRCKIACTDNTAPNGSSTGHPVGVVVIEYRAHIFEISEYEIGIGYSTDNGATFNLLLNSNKWLGYLRSSTSPLWAGKTTHPYTGVAATYWAPSMYSCRTGF